MYLIKCNCWAGFLANKRRRSPGQANRARARATQTKRLARQKMPTKLSGPACRTRYYVRYPIVCRTKYLDRHPQKYRIKCLVRHSLVCRTEYLVRHDPPFYRTKRLVRCGKRAEPDVWTGKKGSSEDEGRRTRCLDRPRR